MDKIMKIFEVNTEIKNYTYPAIKLLACLVVLLILINRNKLFLLEGEKTTFVATVLAFLVALVCIFCIYVSVVEIFELHNRRIENQININEIVTKQYPVETILRLIEKEDIIEIKIKVQQDVVKIGSISDNKWSTNAFFDKIYYCNDIEYVSIEDLREAIMVYQSSETFDVIDIT